MIVVKIIACLIRNNKKNKEEEQRMARNDSDALKIVCGWKCVELTLCFVSGLCCQQVKHEKDSGALDALHGR